MSLDLASLQGNLNGIFYLSYRGKLFLFNYTCFGISHLVLIFSLVCFVSRYIILNGLFNAARILVLVIFLKPILKLV